MQNAAVYIRVSTEDQLEYSPEAQKKAMLNYAAKNNIFVPDEYIYIDEGISGRRANKRPAFMKMIAAAKSKPRLFDFILVHKFDRFARNREDSVVYKSMLLRECGIKVISVTEELSGGDKTSVILEAMLEAMAEYYSLNLSEEVKKGMTEKALRGQIQTCPPFGYDIDGENKRLVINHAEAETVKMIFADFIALAPISRIAKKINAAGIKTRRGNDFEYRTIEYILNNPVYTGKLRWTPTGRTRLNFDNPDSLIIKADHEPIITEEQFETAKNLLKSRKKIYARHNSEYKYFLSGLIKCGACGSALAYTGASESLQCYKYCHGACSISHSISVRKLEAALKKHIESDMSLAGDSDAISGLFGGGLNADEKRAAASSFIETIIFSRPENKLTVYYKNIT